MVRSWLVACAALLASSGLATAQAPAPDSYTGPRLFVFGDSLSDNGNLFLATGGTYPSATTYSWGRASNGPTWSERLGWYLGNAPDVATLQAPWGGFGSAPQGWNFAHYGATVLNSGASPGQKLGTQVGYFARPDARITRFRAQDKIAVWAGANDYLAFGATDTSLVARTLAGHVRTLGQRGGQNMLVLNQPLWGNTPIGFERGDRTALNTLIRAHNTALSTEVASLRSVNRLDAYYINIAALFTDVYVNPSVYGFSVVRPGTTTRGHCIGDGFVLNACPRTYAFYDAVHPSDSLHAVISAYIGSQYGSIDARKLQGAQISQSSANTMALQAAISMGKSVTGANFAQADFGFGDGAPQAFVLSDASPLGASDFGVVLSGLDTGAFTLAGAHLPLGKDGVFTAAVSRGLSEPSVLPDFSGQESEGELVALKQTFGPWQIGVSASRVHQSAMAMRDTGFLYDPVAMAFVEQTESLSLASLTRDFGFGGFSLTPEFAFGTARVKREAVREFSPRGLTAFNLEARTDQADVRRASVQGMWQDHQTQRAVSVAVSAAETDAGVVSAFTVLGLPGLTGADFAPASEAIALSVQASAPLPAGWSLSVSGDAGESDGEARGVMRVSAGKRF